VWLKPPSTAIQFGGGADAFGRAVVGGRRIAQLTEGVRVVLVRVPDVGWPPWLALVVDADSYGVGGFAIGGS
jgi:hypothetical protein